MAVNTPHVCVASYMGLLLVAVLFSFVPAETICPTTPSQLGYPLARFTCKSPTKLAAEEHWRINRATEYKLNINTNDKALCIRLYVCWEGMGGQCGAYGSRGVAPAMEGDGSGRLSMK